MPPSCSCKHGSIPIGRCWCPACEDAWSCSSHSKSCVRIPLPAQRILETFEPNDVAVIGLHATFEHHDAFSVAMLKAFIQEYRPRFPIALDQPNPTSPIPLTMERYKMRGTPSLVLIDRRGVVRKHAFGAVDDLRIGAEIGALTQESEAAALARSSAA